MSAAPREIIVVPEQRAFRTVRLADCAEGGPRWVVQGMIEQGSVTALAGEPGSGKTFLLLDLALHVAAGRDWFGRKVTRGVVLYIAAEAAESVQRRAALVWRVKFENANLPMVIMTEPALLGDDAMCAPDREALERLVDAVAKEYGLPVVLVVVDTIASSMGNGNENLDGMLRLVGAANRLAADKGVAVILNHHPNAVGGTLRGHTSLRGTVSHGFQVETKGDVRIVSAFKQRDAESGRLFTYRLARHDLGEPDNFGDRATSCVIQAADIPEDDGKADVREQTRLGLAVRQVFAAMASAGGLLPFCEILDWCGKECDFLRRKKPETARKAVSRAVTKLTEAGVIQTSEELSGYRLAEGCRT